MFVVSGLAVGLACAFGSKYILEQKGYTDTTLYFWLGFFLGIIGLIIAAVKPALSGPEAVQSVNRTVVQQPQNSDADSLKMYKELLDSGAITQEEFDEKKKQILGL